MNLSLHLKFSPASLVAMTIFITMLISSKVITNAYGRYEPLSGTDHAPIDKRHVDVAEVFVQKYFKDKGEFNATKIAAFLVRLQNELTSLKQDLVNTIILERVEIGVNNLKKAGRSAENKIDLNKTKSKVIKGYTEYLIPKISRLLELVQSNTHHEEWQALTDDFIRGYITYYTPNAHVTPWPFDIDLIHTIQHVLVDMKFKKDDPKKVEANNLITGKKYLSTIQSCLKNNQLSSNHYLTNLELEKLKQCNFDISLLNPGVSALWKDIKDQEINSEDINLYSESNILSSRTSSVSTSSVSMSSLSTTSVAPSSTPSPVASSLSIPYKDKGEYQQILSVDQDIFPTPNEQLNFKKIILTGCGSPKMRVFFYRYGKKISLKLKVGAEVHTDNIISKLFELTGLNSDSTLYMPEAKVYLGDMTYDEFASLLINKYGMEKAIRYISGHGGTIGKEWVLFRDVILEARPEDELRVSSLDLASWDLSNRREYRALLLIWGWVGLNDTKIANIKMLFKKTKQGLKVLHRISDTGTGLGTSFKIKSLNDILTIAQYHKVNAFPSSFIKYENKDTDINTTSASNKTKTKTSTNASTNASTNKHTVSIAWNDFANRERTFNTTTWYDLKWMARKIAAIPESEIRKVLQLSGLPPEVADIYAIKLIMRRNDMVLAFEMEKEYPLYAVPDLKSYNPSQNDLEKNTQRNLKINSENNNENKNEIKNEKNKGSSEFIKNTKTLDSSSATPAVVNNGEVVNTYWKGHTDLFQVQNSWLTLLPGLLNFNIPVQNWNTGNKNVNSTSGLVGIRSLKQELNLTDPGDVFSLTTIPVGIGVSAQLSRKVTTNPVFMNNNGEGLLYKIEDSIVLAIGADSPLLSKILSYMPFATADASVKIYTKEFTFIHYADSVKNAYLKAFNLPKIMYNPQKYAATKLKTLEVIKMSSGVGFELAAGANISLSLPLPVISAVRPITNEASLMLGIRKSDPLYLTRDQFGQLHVYKENTTRKYAGFNIEILNVNLFEAQFPLLLLQMGSGSYDHHMVDYVFSLPEKDREAACKFLNNPDYRKAEYHALKKLLKNEGSPVSTSVSSSSKLSSVSLATPTNNMSTVMPVASKNYEINSKGKSSFSNIGLGFIFHKDKMKEHADTNVVLSDGDEANFHRYATTRTRTSGVSKLTIDFGQSDVLVASRKKTQIVVEMDKENPENFITAIRTEDFYRLGDKDKVEGIIKDLNNRYSESTELPFYREFLLPDTTEVKLYRKIYANTRCFINGQKLISTVLETSKENFQKMAEKHFELDNIDMSRWGKKLKNFITYYRTKSKVKRVVKFFKLLKAEFEKERSQRDYKKIAKLTEKMVHATKTDVYGIGLLRNLFQSRNENGLFIMGDVWGIYNSFNTLQDAQMQQRRRFAGHSWGDLKVVPPIQHFLRYHRLIPPSIFITKTASDKEILGELPVAVPENIKGTFDYNGDF